MGKSARSRKLSTLAEYTEPTLELELAGDELSIAELTAGVDEVAAEEGALDGAMLLGVEDGLVPPPPPPPHAIRLSVMMDNNRAF